MDNNKKQALRECQQDLRTGILLRNFLPELWPLLTDVEYSRIEDQNDNVDMVDMLIRILLTKDNRHFDGFCIVLENNGHESLAKRLRPSKPRKKWFHKRRPTLGVLSEGNESRNALPRSAIIQAQDFSLLVTINHVSITPSQPSHSSSSNHMNHAGGEADSEDLDMHNDTPMQNVLQPLAPDHQVEVGKEQAKCKWQSVVSRPLSDCRSAADVEGKALVFSELYEDVERLKGALRQVLKHRSNIAFTDWAHEVQKLVIAGASARVAGYATAIGGGAVFTAGSGLLLGVVTAPAGIPLMVIGGVLGAAGSVTALGGTITKWIKSKKILKKARQWVKENEHYCRELSDAHDHLMRKKNHIESHSDIDVEQRLSEIFNADITQGLDDVDAIVGSWKSALKYRPEELATVLTTTALCGATITQGVIEGVDPGAEVAAVAVKTTAKVAGAAVAIGLSAILMAVDIGLLAKASYDLHKCRKGKHTKLAEVLLAMAMRMEKETARLRQAAAPLLA